MNISQKNTIDAWKDALRKIIDEGIDFKDKDNRVCRELNNLVVEIKDPTDCESPMEEVKRFDLVYPSREELISIIFNKEDHASYEFSYGPRIFNYGKFKDQINDFIVPLLKKDPTSRRAIITLYNPAVDSDANNKNIPSIISIQFRIIDEKLAITTYIRSNDYFIGWPGNIYQIRKLQEYTSTRIGIKTGSITIISGSGHIFLDQLEQIEKVLD